MAIRAYAAEEKGGEFRDFEYDPGELGRDEVEVKVSSAGICHSDVSMLDNEWGLTRYPFVGGHENVGTVVEKGEGVEHLEVGQTVGVGWFSGSCMTCEWCVGGKHNFCSEGQGTIVGRHGGFAERLRCHKTWAIPIPDGVARDDMGPLLCGGITVYTPIAEFGLEPAHRVGVVGIGGLGHMAVMMANKWGCEVTAFTTSMDKADELRELGAHRVVNSKEPSELKKIEGSLDMVISTVNVSLDWGAYLAALRPEGRLHTVGAVLEPMEIKAFDLIMGGKSVSGSPTGNPGRMSEMLGFCARHGIAPVTEHYPMSEINDAFERLRAGKARYRIVLDAD
ncbi:MAG: NAD(P)-dependent alcohol dehydrogenase [Planctomycetota bacterium]